MVRKKSSGLGKGLDSLIPDLYNEDSSSMSLEDILNEEPKKESKPKKSTKKISVKKDEVENKAKKSTKKESTNVDSKSIEEVKEIVNKNPRITLWSARSAAVFRYLRKTEPEFSISKEASTLIDEAVSSKYPEIWKLFDI
ncbi:AAA family ATPase [Methanobrevibacter sp. OttesenSCG-928-I08]|nr:AAA family ATPase [Methanobrevibacter sp. OttesenSCG-928-I08]